MIYKPHDYQTFATSFILSHPVAAVFLQMGLGKSVITLTALRELFSRGEIHKVLVIAPLRVARDTWPSELRKWDHLAGLTFSVAVGSARQRRAALMSDAQIHIINRENIPWLIEESGLPFDYDTLVIDELSSFKNWQARRFRSLLKVRPLATRVIGLTGTPSPNGLMDLFAQFRILDLGERLGRYITRYREAYFLPDRCSAGQVFTWKLRPGAGEEIYARIADITVSMQSVDYLKMPELITNRYPVILSEDERYLYDSLREDMILQLRDQVIDAKNAAALSGKLSQMASGAVYAEDHSVVHIHDRKLDALEDLVEAAGANPLLVAYWFRHDLDRLRQRFPGIRPLQTSQDIRDWNTGKIPIAAIHPASAGHGLNLQSGGSTLVWFGLTWSLELYQQTNARLWRQGQTADTVVIYHIVAENTMDEAVLKALQSKEATQENLLCAVRAELGNGSLRSNIGGETDIGSRRSAPLLPAVTAVSKGDVAHVRL